MLQQNQIERREEKMVRHTKAIDSLIESAFDSELDAVLSNSWTLRDPAAYVGDKLPVDIIEFAESKKFLGLKGQLYPEIKNILIDIEDPSIREIDLILGKGSGKSMVATIFTAYGGYQLLQLKQPQRMFGLIDATQIYSINVSVSKDQAKDNIFASLKAMLKNSPYFRGRFAIDDDPYGISKKQVKNLKQDVAISIDPNAGAEEFRLAVESRLAGSQTNKTGESAVAVALPKGIHFLCGHSNNTAFLGYATYRAVMDECNFMFNNNNRSVAEDLYNALKGSLKTRFPNDYKLLSISSDSTPNSFLRSRYAHLKELASREKTEAANERRPLRPLPTVDDYLELSF